MNVNYSTFMHLVFRKRELKTNLTLKSIAVNSVMKMERKSISNHNNYNFHNNDTNINNNKCNNDNNNGGNKHEN